MFSNLQDLVRKPEDVFNIFNNRIKISFDSLISYFTIFINRMDEIIF